MSILMCVLFSPSFGRVEQEFAIVFCDVSKEVARRSVIESEDNNIIKHKRPIEVKKDPQCLNLIALWHLPLLKGDQKIYKTQNISKMIKRQLFKSESIFLK